MYAITYEDSLFAIHGQNMLDIVKPYREYFYCMTKTDYKLLYTPNMGITYIHTYNKNVSYTALP